MKYVHPDIVVGEAIPEIEPRVDAEVLTVVRKFVRVGYVIIPIYVAIAIGFVFIHPSIFVLMGTVLAGFSIWLALVTWHKESLKTLKSNEWCIPLADVMKYRVVSVGIWISMFLPTLAYIGLYAIPLLGGMLLLFSGFAWISISRRARQPGQISCDACSYPLVGLVLPCMCPECGVSILDAQYTTYCPRVDSPWLSKFGVLLVFFGAMGLYASFDHSEIFYNVLPGPAMKAMAITDDEAFERYTQNPMSAEESSEFTESLIKWGQSNRLGSFQQDWLMRLRAAGELTGGQIETIMEGVPPIRIAGPTVMRVGDETEISLESTKLNTPGISFTPFYFFRGFKIDEDPTLYSGSDDYRWWMRLHADLYRSESVADDPSNRPFYTIKAEQPGEIVVRGRVVVVLTYEKNLLTFVWDGDGEGVFENEPLWVRTIDLEHTIAVESAAEGDGGG